MEIFTSAGTIVECHLNYDYSLFNQKTKEFVTFNWIVPKNLSGLFYEINWCETFNLQTPYIYML